MHTERFGGEPAPALRGPHRLQVQPRHHRTAEGKRRAPLRQPTSSTPTRTAGAATTPSSLAPPSSGSSPWTRRCPHPPSNRVPHVSTLRRGMRQLTPPPSANAPSTKSRRVKWDPAWGEERITNMVATRPDWCISRQRIWGVPIAVFLCRKCGDAAQRRRRQQAHRRPLHQGIRRRLVHPHARGDSPRRNRLHLRPHRIPQRDGHPRRLVRVRSQLPRRPRLRPRHAAEAAATRPPLRPLRRGRRPASRLVHVFPALHHRHAQPRALQG